MSKNILFYIVITLCLMSPAVPVFAQNLTYQPLEPLPGLNDGGETPSLQALFSYAFRLLFAVGGLVAVLTLIMGGITYMVSDVVDKRSEARKRIQGSMWGLGLLILSYIILNTINPQLLSFNFNPGQLSTSSDGTSGSLRTTVDQSTGGVQVYDSDKPEVVTAALASYNKNQCGNRGIHSTGEGTDSRGHYSIYTCL